MIPKFSRRSADNAIIRVLDHVYKLKLKSIMRIFIDFRVLLILYGDHCFWWDWENMVGYEPLWSSKVLFTKKKHHHNISKPREYPQLLVFMEPTLWNNYIGWSVGNFRTAMWNYCHCRRLRSPAEKNWNKKALLLWKW